MADRSRRVVWARGALVGLHEILDFVSHQSPSAARDLCATLLERASSLSTLSHRGRVVPEINSLSVREIIVHRYRVMYEVDSDRVVILAVVHGARDFLKWSKKQ